MLSKDSVAWRLMPLMDDRGALSDGEIAELSAQFGFSVPEIERLSFALSIALDPERYLVREESKVRVSRDGGQ